MSLGVKRFIGLAVSYKLLAVRVPFALLCAFASLWRKFATKAQRGTKEVLDDSGPIIGLGHVYAQI